MDMSEVNVSSFSNKSNETRGWYSGHQFWRQGPLPTKQSYNQENCLNDIFNTMYRVIWHWFLRDVILTLVSVKELSSKRTLQSWLGYKLHYEKWVIGKLLFYNFLCVFSLSFGKISNKKQLKRKKIDFFLLLWRRLPGDWSCGILSWEGKSECWWLTHCIPSPVTQCGFPGQGMMPSTSVVKPVWKGS